MTQIPFSTNHGTLHPSLTDEISHMLTRLCSGAPLGLRACGPGRLERLGKRLLELRRRVSRTSACAQMQLGPWLLRGHGLTVQNQLQVQA